MDSPLESVHQVTICQSECGSRTTPAEIGAPPHRGTHNGLQRNRLSRLAIQSKKLSSLRLATMRNKLLSNRRSVTMPNMLPRHLWTTRNPHRDKLALRMLVASKRILRSTCAERTLAAPGLSRLPRSFPRLSNQPKMTSPSVNGPTARLLCSVIDPRSGLTASLAGAVH